MSDDNGWSEYSKLVLKELSSLASSIQSLNNEIQELKQEITRMREREDRVEELRAWKDRLLNYKLFSKKSNLLKNLKQNQ